MNRGQRKFNKIYDRYVQNIYRFIFIKVNSQEMAEDLTSETFIRVWQVFQSEDKKEIKNPKAFLYATARNLVIDFYRTRETTRTLSIEDNIDIEDKGQTIEEKAKISSDLELVKKGLGGLRQDYQNVIVWHYVDGLSVGEIANVLTKTPGAVRVLLHRAMEQLKEEVKR